MGTPWPWVPGGQHQPVPREAPRVAGPGLPAEAPQPTREPARTGAGPRGSGQGPAGRGGNASPTGRPAAIWFPSAQPSSAQLQRAPRPATSSALAVREGTRTAGFLPSPAEPQGAAWHPHQGGCLPPDPPQPPEPPGRGPHAAHEASAPTSGATRSPRCAPSRHTAFAWAVPSALSLCSAYCCRHQGPPNFSLLARGPHICAFNDRTISPTGPQCPARHPHVKANTRHRGWPAGLR